MSAKQLSQSRQSLLAARARFMRREPTFEERILWQAIRGRRLGVVFRRQVPLAGRYIADFCAPPAKGVVEVDGGIHSRRVRADARRDAVLGRLGYRVVRVEAELVTNDLPRAVARVWQALAGGGAG